MRCGAGLSIVGRKFSRTRNVEGSAVFWVNLNKGRREVEGYVACWGTGEGG
jgi:hypothetical protein